MQTSNKSFNVLSYTYTFNYVYTYVMWTIGHDMVIIGVYILLTFQSQFSITLNFMH